MIPLPENKIFKGKWNGVISLVLPYRCLVTGEIIETNAGLSPKAWGELTFISDPKCKVCGIPFAYSDAEVDCQSHEDSPLCIDCLEHRPVYDKALSTLIYDDASRPLILGYKHGDQLHMAVSFTDWMYKTGQEFFGEADYIIPVPLHWKRLLKRRYNQSALLAGRLSKLSGVEVLKQTLIRTRATPPQGHMSAKDRSRNVKHAFICKDNKDLNNKTVVLIDDVLTSGSTANECAKILKQAGCAKVYVLCLARVAHL